jgi:N-acetyl-gamma-glutamyl-phosphate reductase
VAEGVRAYSVGEHRHRPEIEMGLDSLYRTTSRVTFTPHLIPMQRGLLATVTAPLQGDHERPDLMAILRDAYRGQPFVEVIERPPQTRWVAGSNRALVTVYVDAGRGKAIACAAIDNLGKGAAGQAVQAANIICGLPEAEGLPIAGWMP